MVDHDKFIELINRLEGYKTRATNLHWVATSAESHRCAESIHELINRYQDKIVEIYLSVYSNSIDSNSLTSGVFRTNTLNDLIDNMIKYLSEYMTLLNRDSSDINKMLLNIIEDFKIDIHIKKYLNNLN